MPPTDDTGSLPAGSFRVLRSEIQSLREAMTSGFANLETRLEDLKELDKSHEERLRTLEICKHDPGDHETRLRALELIEAKSEGSNYDRRIASMSSKLAELERWRWKMIGVLSVVTVILSVAIAIGKDLLS